MAITKDDILKAADALERDNERVTMETVRQFLGGGSFATISPVLREWKESRKSQVAIVIDMPAELKKAAERLEAEFWQVASGLANERLVAVQAESDAKVEEAQAERDEALQEVSRLEVEIENLSAQQQQLTEQLAEKEQKIANLEKALLTQRTQAEQLLTQHNALSETNKEQATEIKQQSSIIQDLEKALLTQRTQAEQLLTQHNALSETNKEQAAEIKQQSSVIQGLEKENALMEQTVGATKAAGAEVKAQSAQEIKDLIAGHKDTLITLREATDKATADLKESHAKMVATLEKSLQDAQKQRDEARAEATASKKEADKLKATKAATKPAHKVSGQQQTLVDDR